MLEITYQLTVYYLVVHVKCSLKSYSAHFQRWQRLKFQHPATFCVSRALVKLYYDTKHFDFLLAIQVYGIV